MNFATWLGTVLAPTWLRGPWAAKWHAVIGGALDTIAAANKSAVKVSQPQLAPPDALAFIGSDRKLPRYAAESDAQYAARLQGAWDAYAQGGTTTGIASQLTACGFTGTITFYPVGGGAPSWWGAAPWPPPGLGSGWSRFWIELDSPFPWPWVIVQWGATGAKWGAAGSTWGSTATHDQIAALRGIVKKWKPAHELCGGFFVRLPTNQVLTMIGV